MSGSDHDQTRHSEESQHGGLLDRHPKLGILLIAGIFYVVLFGMCAFVAVLIWTQ